MSSSLLQPQIWQVYESFHKNAMFGTNWYQSYLPKMAHLQWFMTSKFGKFMNPFIKLPCLA